MRGYAAIGLIRPKSHHNVGSVLRAAYCYEAAMVAIQGERSPIKSSLDTTNTFKHIPVLRGENLHDLVPYDCVPIAVDLVEGATSLAAFQHPIRAFYVFGPEDGTLGKAVLSWCKYSVMVPTRNCMNLAATVNVVLYDRAAKHERSQRRMTCSTVS